MIYKTVCNDWNKLTAVCFANTYLKAEIDCFFDHGFPSTTDLVEHEVQVCLVDSVIKEVVR